MRVLIVTAFFACAAAAPSGIVAPYFYQAVAVPAAVPISSGDIQAAAIDAQVKINDLAQAAADQARLVADQNQYIADQNQNIADKAQVIADQNQNVAEQAVASTYESSLPNADLANEKNIEAFWSNVDKQYQAIDALKTAQAQIDGAIARNAAEYAKVAAAGVVPYVAAAPVAPVVAAAIPSPVVYSPYIAAVKSVAAQVGEVKAEEKKDEKQEAVVKTAEPEKQAVVETAEKTEAEKSDDKAVAFGNTIVTPYSTVYTYNGPAPVYRSFVPQPVFNYAPVHPVLTPTYLRSVW